MKHLLLTSFLVCTFTLAFAQDSTNEVSLFKNINIKTGLNLSYFNNFQGEYVYILQNNASVLEERDNRNGGAISFVVIFPLDEKGLLNFMLSVPFLDYKSGNAMTAQSNLKLFNSQTPFGLGLSVSPFKKRVFLGFQVW